MRNAQKPALFCDGREEDPYFIDVPRPLPGGPPLPVPPDWDEVYGRSRPLRVEIGFGRSEFLIEVALSHPAFNYLGFEYSRRRVNRFLKKVHRVGVENIRTVCRDASTVLEHMVPPQRVDRFYILFPDPWPKRRHAKKRFVQERNVRVLVDRLLPAGGISLRTDDADYARQMLEVLDACPALGNLAGSGTFSPQPRDPFKTLYQAKWEEEGRNIFFLEYDRV